MNISIIIPVRKRFDNLQASIQSLLNSFNNKDICVVENDENPNSMDFCKSKKINYIFIPIEKNKFNKCLCFNMGFLFMDNKKHYEYTLFHDVDIVVKSDFYQKLKENIYYNNNPNCMQPYGKKCILYTDQPLGDQILKKSVDIDKINDKYPGIFVPYAALSKGIFSKGGSILVKNKTYYEVGGFDHDLFHGYAPEDSYFWEKVATNNEIKFADFPNIEMIHVWHKSESNSNPEKLKLENIFENFKKLNKNEKNKIINESVNKLLNLKENIPVKKNNFVSFKKLGEFGRLGNQLFQLAATISYAKDNNLFIDVDWGKYSNFFENSLQTKKNQGQYIDYNEKNLNFKEIPFDKKNINLHGYFQSEKYFQNNKNLIKYYFSPKKEILINLKNKYKQISNITTCSVHVRRKDYVNNKMHDICKVDYFNKAIEKINSLIKIEKFLFFSDDIGWCKKNFTSENFIFIENNNEIEDLFLMSMCTHNIISNSTFSWWGSWLNDNENKIIIAPSKWFSDTSGIKNDDIYTENMIKIEV